MTTSTTKKTPNELQLAEGQSENYMGADLDDNTTPLACPSWCQRHDDTGGGAVHATVTGREEGFWVVEASLEDDYEDGTRRAFVFAEVSHISDELTPEQALAMAAALTRAAELLGVES